MADLPNPPKRPNYFQAQFLVVRDFEDEQSYHREMLKRHNRNLHEWGVVRDGLSVTKTGDNQNLSISPGSAIDSLGREIVLEAAQLLSLDKVRAASQAAGPAQDVAITIAFRETDSTAPEDKYPGTDNVTRQMQAPIIDATKTPATDGTVITLARVSVAANNDVGQPNNGVRKLASSFIARGSNLGDISLDGSLSFTSKSSQKPTYPQLGLDYDSGSDALRIRARTKDAPALDATHLSIKRDTGNIGFGMPPAAARLSVQAAPYSGTLMDFAIGDIYRLTLGYSAFERDTVSYYFDLANNLGNKFEKFLVFHKGNVGVGTVPNAKLQIGDGADTSLVIGDRKLAGSVGLQFLGLGYKNAGLRFDGDNLIVEDASNSFLPSTWYTPNNAMNLIVRTGNVGIGLTNPSARLAMQGDDKLEQVPSTTTFSTASERDTNVYFIPAGTDVSGVRVGDLVQMGDERKVVTDVNSQAYVRVKAPGFRARSGNLYLVRPNNPIFRADDYRGDPKLFIASQGNVGIGTINPLGPLSIGDSSVDGSDGYIVIGKKHGGGTRHFKLGFDSGFRFIIGDFGNNNVAGTWTSPFAMDWSAPSNAFCIKDSGNVGIGVAAPVTALQVQGQIAMTQTANNTAAKALLDKLPNSTLIIGGVWSNGLYFYWKNPDGTKLAAILQGSGL